MEGDIVLFCKDEIDEEQMTRKLEEMFPTYGHAYNEEGLLDFGGCNECEAPWDGELMACKPNGKIVGYLSETDDKERQVDPVDSLPSDNGEHVLCWR
ncbi:hypothetical protein GOP47_0024368 [Adiantum capillus-veneris]|uniref:Uncharacterized protein n=1 Tax=Adiantum capillus-veneris TaxID=13818 RepID=A0A9D4Z2Q3_ADICA|nr:hypothetical protein GOP47_0024368 [Adiantum capillus-veneris]